jgi:hypothetical protein
MNKLILIPLKRSDRAEDFIPYIAEVARPGMQVVFMVPYAIDGFRRSRVDYGRRATVEGIRLANYYKWETNLETAKTRLAPALATMKTNGIEAAVDVYVGSMRSVLRSYAAKGDVYLIVTRASIWQKIAGLLTGDNSLWGLFKRPTFSPVLLMHPMTIT